MKKRAGLCFLTVCALLLFSGMLQQGQAESGSACNHYWEVQTIQPTCTEDGREICRCSICGEEQIQTIPALGHEWGMCMMVTKATCTEEGLIRCFCSRDDSHYEDKPVDALGHDWEEWTTVKAAGLNTPGMKERRCRRCGSIEQQEIPARVRRKDYSLTLIMAPAPGHDPDKSEYSPAFECALINTGKKDLQIRCYSLNGEDEQRQLEEPLMLPAGRLSVFPLARQGPEAETGSNPELRDGEGAIQCEACFYGETADGKQVCASNTVTVYSQVHADSGIRVTQAIASEPADAAGYRQNEGVQYTVTVENHSGRMLEGSFLKGTASEEQVPVPSLQPGEAWTASCEHRVTLEDAINGYACWTQTLREGGEMEPEGALAFSNMLIVPVWAK